MNENQQLKIFQEQNTNLVEEIKREKNQDLEEKRVIPTPNNVLLRDSCSYDTPLKSSQKVSNSNSVQKHLEQNLKKLPKVKNTDRDS